MQFQLIPNASFLIRFSKPGFQDVTLNVNTSPNDNRVLRNVDILPVGASGKISSTSSDPIFFTEGTPEEAGSKISTTSGNPGATNPNSSTTARSIVSGFSVQVASVKGKLSDENFGTYQNKLGDLGTVYTVEEGGRTKVRLGVIEDRNDAKALQKLVNAKGYDGAFIVTETNRAIEGVPESFNAETKRIPVNSQPNVGSEADLKGIMVRLAAYSNMAYFDKGMVDDLGTLTYVPKGDFTVVLLRGYSTTDDALIALRKVKVRGFTDAHLVEYDMGEMKKIK